MLRVLSSRCFGTASGVWNELRIINVKCPLNLTSHQNVLSSPYSHLRSMSTTIDRDSKDDKNIVVVYRGKLERQIMRVKILSMTTSLMGFGAQPYIYSEASSLPILIASSAVVGFFTFVTPILLHQLAKRHVNRVTYNKETDSYIAHTTTFFFREKQITIQPGEAKVPDIGGIFTSVEVRGIPLMMEMEAFHKEHLIRLLGYDKPLDLEHERLAELVKKADERVEARNKLKEKSLEDSTIKGSICNEKQHRKESRQ